MGIYLNPRSERFQTSLRSEIYVDKSMLIAQMNRRVRTEQKFICVSRPRRFGKSMAAEMLAAYYRSGEDTAPLFDGLKIAGEASYREHLNRYDVVKINMQEFLSSTHDMDEMLKKLRKYVLFDLLEQYEHLRFRDESDLIQVMKDIFSKTNRPFVILIDEWDCLFREYLTTHRKKYLDFPYGSRISLCGAGLYDGILPIKSTALTRPQYVPEY